MNARVERHMAAEQPALVATLVRERVGALGGEEVRVKDASSVLDDAKEEISMAHSEKVEAKEFGEREIAGGHSRLKIRVDEVQTYMHAMRRQYDTDKLGELLRRLLGGNQHPRAAIRRESSNPTMRYSLLSLAIGEARARKLPQAEIAKLEEALVEIEAAYGPRILADVNGAEVAGKFASDAQGVENFQETYAKLALDQASFAQNLTLVLKRLAGAQGDDFLRGLKALLDAAGADMRAADSSTDKTRLRSLVDDIYQFELAHTVLEECTNLSGTLAQHFGIDSVIPMSLMQELVALTTERWVAPDRLRMLAEKFAVKQLLARIAFYTGAKTALRKMPVKVFSDPESRKGVLDGAQAALDGAVAEEEEKQGS
jgi:type III secretion protein W